MFVQTTCNDLVVSEADNSISHPRREEPLKNDALDLLLQLRKAYDTPPPAGAKAQSDHRSLGLAQQTLERWLLYSQQKDGPPDRLRPAKLVAEHYGICLRTLDRWLADEHLSFPRPITVKRRRYFRELDLVFWELRRHSDVAAKVRA